MKKFISVVLCMVLIVTSFAISVSAEEKLSYLVLGDSIAYASGVKNAKEACYGKIVADTNGYEYSNYAVPGHTTTNLINRLSEEAVSDAVENADIISISIGGNDFLMNNIIGLMYDSIVKNDYSKFDDIAESFYNNFSRIIDIINEKNEDAVILMQTLYNPQSGYLRAPYQQGADRINNAINRYAQENPGEIVIVDVATALGDDPENFAGDNIHPSVKGNEIIADVVLEKLSEIKLGNTTQAVISEKGQDIEISPIFASIFNIYGVVFHIISVIRNFVLNIIPIG
ncbi:MAG: SGNH/GDSL hydrolase family protein [Clostridia bacterium]|nr:SGNH/GDSL hydrolase family protein [Clostridia bacterium]